MQNGRGEVASLLYFSAFVSDRGRQSNPGKVSNFAVHTNVAYVMCNYFFFSNGLGCYFPAVKVSLNDKKSRKYNVGSVALYTK